MSIFCELCGRGKVPSRDSDTKVQLKQITRRINDIEHTKETNYAIKTALENKIMRDVERKAALKEKYLELLRNKENAKKRLFQLKELHSGGISRIEDLRESADGKALSLRAASETLKHLDEALHDQSHELYAARMFAAVRTFKMMTVDAHPPNKNQSKPGKQGSTESTIELSGCSTIMSLPLPNSGNYSGVPLDVLTPAIAHITHLVDTLSATLNIPLPHTLYPFDSSDCMVSAQHDLWARANVRSACYSLAPVTYISDRTQFRDFDWTSLEHIQAPASNTAPGGPHTSKPQPPNTGSASQYAANPNFPGSLVLLQANIIALCLRVGIPPEGLWPPEAMLYNLHLLHKHCAAVVREQERFVSAADSCGELRPVSLDSANPLLEAVQNNAALHSILDRHGSDAAVREHQRLAYEYAGANDGVVLTMEDSDDGVMIRSELMSGADWNMVYNGVTDSK